MTSLSNGESADPGIPTLTEVLSPGQMPASLQVSTETEAGVPSDVAVLAQRVSARLSRQLADDLTAQLEQRVHNALIDQTAWLVQFISKQVVDELQQQLPERIRQAMLEEMARQPR